MYNDHNHSYGRHGRSPAQSSAGPHYSPSRSPPLTPPPLNLVGSPYSRAPLPAVPEADLFAFYPQPLCRQTIPIVIHSCLRCSLSGPPNVNCDLSRHPSTITTSHDHRPLPIITLAEPATNPALPTLTIVSPNLPWPIVVSAQKPGSYVSVSDVFMALHHALSIPVSPLEYPSPSSSPGGVLFRGHGVYDHRSSPPSPHWHAYERPSLRRIDFLSGRTRFMGLSAMGRDPGTYVLSTC